jgi:hypothetical protein
MRRRTDNFMSTISAGKLDNLSGYIAGTVSGRTVETRKAGQHPRQ